ncbi:hypothetical protein [Agrobacterium salinitolerans]|uniref:hypothetical protein n=1 Tax=Agrobacterium salinitolerans TaxID=1183413 RepID=UPI001572F951|nr:hypothetical protein [Agrobacterium salinitolerans]NTA35992.1 hypothetical protein [Agrobacterium salinitolerans]
MHIIDMKPLDEPPGGNRAIATFDLELDDNVRLYALRLLEMRDGKHFVFAPQSGSRRVATFRREFAEALTNLALEELKAVTANDSNRH